MLIVDIHFIDVGEPLERHHVFSFHHIDVCGPEQVRGRSHGFLFLIQETYGVCVCVYGMLLF